MRAINRHKAGPGWAKALVIWALAHGLVLSGSAWAQRQTLQQPQQTQALGHTNAVMLWRDSAGVVGFDFLLNLPQVLHAVLAPQTAYLDFLKTGSEFSDREMARAIAKATQALSAQTYLLRPSGDKLRLKAWRLPDPPGLRELFKTSLMLQRLPSGAADHLDPVPVQAQLSAQAAIGRFQLHMPLALRPILVQVKNDRFWLTEQVPMAVVDLD